LLHPEKGSNDLFKRISLLPVTNKLPRRTAQYVVQHKLPCYVVPSELAILYYGRDSTNTHKST